MKIPDKCPRCGVDVELFSSDIECGHGCGWRMHLPELLQISDTAMHDADEVHMGRTDPISRYQAIGAYRKAAGT